MTSQKSVKKRRQQLHARDVRGLAAFCFYPLQEKIINKSCFQSIFQVQTMFTSFSRPDKHAELLKNYFKPLVKQLKISTLVAKSEPGRVAQSVGHLTRKSGVLGSIPGLATYFRFSFRFFKKGSCQLLAKVCARSTG